MKFTLGWLKQHLDTETSLDALCTKLTALGLEVESVRDPGKALGPFIIAHVLTAEKHPDADRLKIAVVDTGKEKLQVVCGAPNCRAGMKVVLARPGDVMPNTGEPLKKGMIRGKESQGMLCAADELKLQEDETDGIIELPATAPLGESYARYAKLDDPVIEINLTPNRPDCAGVYGIARDLAAAGMGKLKSLSAQPIPGKGSSPIKIKLDFGAADKACPLFVGRLIKNINNGPSPQWLQQRLMAIGLRPISALVDITNYLTFDCARPLHVFDAKKIRGNLWVRPAKGGESFEALDGNKYRLEQGMTIIGDESGVLSLAGIMGGLSSKCDEMTTDVFVESALFDPIRTTRTARALQIISDARYRFERGVDPLFTIPGMELATQLVLDFCSTPQTIVHDLEIAGKTPRREIPIILNGKKCLRHAGVDVSESEQEKILSSLGFTVQKNDNNFSVMPPSWRPDIEGDTDLVEEIIRVKGFEHIPVVSLSRPDAITKTAIDIEDQRGNAARHALASQGLLETVTWSFMSGVIATQFGGGDLNLKLSNPISSDLDVMRPSILGNLIMAAKRNADRGFSDVGLFEVGPVYKDATPEGQATVATLIRAGSTPRHWTTPARTVDVFDAKADALMALAAAGAPVQSLQIATDAPPWYHPGQSGSLRLGPTFLAYFGEIHPSVLAACDMTGSVVGAEIFIANIPHSRTVNTARPLLKLEPLQPVIRDFAFIVADNVTAARLIKAIREAEKNIIKDVTVFDVYEGDRVEAGKKSVALSVTLQPTGKTFTDSEIEAIASRIAASAAKATGAALRG